ncbi:hypothetical protein NE237_006017 [Protea cynaroides]|uniref:Uncharacterized protein n=1 Tax=Protea cynaroides TaxID=273540 RepID=A0A9Q0KLG2_9MAGN|nr:hypothetical protein NE237_006017 [Protea cynaroides]
MFGDDAVHELVDFGDELGASEPYILRVEPGQPRQVVGPVELHHFHCLENPVTIEGLVLSGRACASIRRNYRENRKCLLVLLAVAGRDHTIIAEGIRYIRFHLPLYISLTENPKSRLSRSLMVSIKV